jgi:hypothetical protein
MGNAESAFKKRR